MVLPFQSRVSLVLRLLAGVAAGGATFVARAQSVADVAEDEPVELSPFMVEGRFEEAYQARQTLAGTRVRTDLGDLGAPITVITPKFMQDLGATNSLTLLQYTINTEIGGVYGNFAGVGDGPQSAETEILLHPAQNTRVRGLTRADNTRNFFLTEIPWDVYNVDRLDVQRGPNSILFGVGSPAGILNANLTDARLRNGARFESRVGSHGTLRHVIDLNLALVPNELGVRVAVLDQHERFHQRPAFNRDRRAYAALRYDPRWAAKGAAHTTLRLHVERGDIEANRPRTLPPVDALTPWFAPAPSGLGRQTFDPRTAWAPGGPADPGGAAFNPWFNEAFFGRMFNSTLSLAFEPDASAPRSARQAVIATRFGLRADGTIDGGIDGLPFARPLGIATYSAYARAARLPGAAYNVYKDRFLADPAVFDFFGSLLDGPNKGERQRWSALNFDASQSFLDQRLAFNLAYFHQDYEEGQRSLLAGHAYAVSVDVNAVLADGTPNPDAGRPYVANNGFDGNVWSRFGRDALRLTAAGEIRARDWLGRGRAATLLGRHALTALLSRDRVTEESRQWSRFAADTDWAEATGGSRHLSDGDRQLDWVTYLGPSLLDAPGPAAQRLAPITTTLLPPAGVTARYFDARWARPADPADPAYVDPAAPWFDPRTSAPSLQAENPANYGGWRNRTFSLLRADAGDQAQLHRLGHKRRNVVTSAALTWQGHLWNDSLVPTFGWRHDKVGIWSSAAPVDPATGLAATSYGLGPRLREQADESRSWSVVLRPPRGVQLPWGTSVSAFYYQGRNFKADQVRVDVEGRPLDPQVGHTRDFGLVISTLEDRLWIKLNAYRTGVRHATLEGTGAGLGANLYYVHLLEAWGTASAVMGARGLAGDPEVQGLAWYWDWASHDVGTPAGAYPRSGAGAAVDAAQQRAIRSWFDQMAPQDFFDAYGLPVNVAAVQAGDFSAGLLGWTPAAGVGALQSATGGTIRGVAPVATVDTTSRGLELELMARPSPHWDLSLSVARTQARRSRLNATLESWVRAQKTRFGSPAGELRLWSAGDRTVRELWEENVYSPYRLLVAQEGTSAPEIRPWRATVLTNHRIAAGRLRGLDLGGAIRWQEGHVLGYALDAAQLLDPSRPFRGPASLAVDGWIGYERKLRGRFTWRVQLNLRNLGDRERLVPITVQPDGSPAAFRIQEGFGWQLTNTVSF